MAKERRDKKNRILRQGEYQRSDGRYMYRYTDPKGNTRFVYSWTLTQSDRFPPGKPSGKCLRELERDIAKDVQDGIDTQASRKLTLNAFWDDYISQKHELKSSTRVNYRYMFDHYVRDNWGNRKLPDIKYSDVKKFYSSFISEKGFSPNSMEIIHTILHPVFDTAVRDGYIRLNPTDGVMTEIKKAIAGKRANAMH